MSIAGNKRKDTLKLQATNRSVLLVEDYAANVLVAVITLENMGYCCDVAANGKEALEKIRSGRAKYIAVLMDIQMPDMDGFEVTRIIREEEKAKHLPHLPIIAMTAHTLSGDKERCLEAGMDGYISKPFDTRKLMAAFDNLYECNRRLSAEREVA